MSCRSSKNDDGDLGLGRGLKPGGLERDDEDVFLTHTDESLRRSQFNSSRQSVFRPVLVEDKCLNSMQPLHPSSNISYPRAPSSVFKQSAIPRTKHALPSPGAKNISEQLVQQLTDKLKYFGRNLSPVSTIGSYERSSNEYCNDQKEKPDGNCRVRLKEKSAPGSDYRTDAMHSDVTHSDVMHSDVKHSEYGMASSPSINAESTSGNADSRESPMKHNDTETLCVSGTKQQELLSGSDRCNCRDLQKKLKEKEEETDRLKLSMEICQLQFKSKYQAAKILQQQLHTMELRQQQTVNEYKKLNKKLTQDVNGLQYALDVTLGALGDSQLTWVERFDSICQENKELKDELQTQRKLFAEKLRLCREGSIDDADWLTASHSDLSSESSVSVTSNHINDESMRKSDQRKDLKHSLDEIAKH